MTIETVSGLHMEISAFEVQFLPFYVWAKVYYIETVKNITVKQDQI